MLKVSPILQRTDSVLSQLGNSQYTVRGGSNITYLSRQSEEPCLIGPLQRLLVFRRFREAAW
jgi:hypothetical protein